MSRMNRVGMLAGAGLTTAIVGLAALASGSAIARAEARQNPPAAKTVWDGVYTTDQSKRGEGLSDAACTACHGDKLVGSDIGPPLLGDGFLGTWAGATAYDLFDKLSTTMPANGPGTLKPQEYADLLAYMFQLNGFPAGSTELASTSAELKLVKVTATKP